MPEPVITSLKPRLLAGMCMPMSLLNDATPLLWKSFMPHRNRIPGRVSANLFSLQVYPDDYFQVFNPGRFFEKWALAEVRTIEDVPEGMKAFHLEGGVYAVFQHKGTDISIFQFIYAEWIPNSAYELDHRPHFEVLGENYRQGDPASEEEIWIPVKCRS